MKKIFKLSAEPLEAEADWERFLEAYRLDGNAPSEKKIIQSPVFLKLFGNSRFLTRFIIKNPSIINEVIQSPYLTKEKKTNLFFEEVKRIQERNLNRYFCLLKIYKYRELLRITLKDLNNVEPPEILAELSSLAMALVVCADKKLHEELLKKNSIQKQTRKIPFSYNLMALGKLGGEELNFSSDIDLMMVISDDKGEEGTISPHEFFVRQAQRFGRLFQEETSDGFLYRVDWDLRPEGKGGTLVNSLSAFESYYEAFGQDWERQALTKCRPLSGSQQLGDKFLRMIEPFVYRKYLDLENIHNIRRLKEKLHEELMKKKEPGFNVKLGLGGIREVEFFIQTILLIYGGKKHELRTTNTLELIDNLDKSRLIGGKVALLLRKGYLFLRKLENRLQMVDERQTHLLLDDEEHRLKMARRMGYSSPEGNAALISFNSDLLQHTLAIHQIFESLFSDGGLNNASKGALSVPKQLRTLSGAVESDELQPENNLGLEPLRNAIKKRVASWPSFEERLDELRYFKKDELRKIRELETEPDIPRAFICAKLSDVAEVICESALQTAVEAIQKKHGKPTCPSPSGSLTTSTLTPIAMGKLGGREINYQSDLDFIFIYSEEGETSGLNGHGSSSISNSEFFCRVVQKFMSILSLMTRAGTAYSIDTELRPSGNAGPLVTSLESFLDYQRDSAELWEHQALLKARPLLPHNPLSRLIKHHLSALLYSSPLSDESRPEMTRLRKRVEQELARESKTHIDIKLGYGSMMDIEYIFNYHQLRFGAEYPPLKTLNTFDGLKSLVSLKRFPLSDSSLLMEAYNFYRTLEAKIQLKKGRSEHRFLTADPLWDKVAEDFKLDRREKLLKTVFNFKDRVRNIYNKVFFK